MNISLKWLKQYLDFDLTAQEVGDALTSLGLEVGAVEEVETIRGGLKGIVVGKVLTCEPHPNSDHLHLTTVDLGNGEEPVQIVCGAPNVAAGQKVIVATVGTVLYDGDKEFVIKKSKRMRLALAATMPASSCSLTTQWWEHPQPLIMASRATGSLRWTLLLTALTAVRTTA